MSLRQVGSGMTQGPFVYGFHSLISCPPTAKALCHTSLRSVEGARGWRAENALYLLYTISELPSSAAQHT